MSKEDQGKLIKNYVRLVAELPTTDIADYLKQNQIFTEEMVERILMSHVLFKGCNVVGLTSQILKHLNFVIC
jgi:hypothetical protein